MPTNANMPKASRDYKAPRHDPLGEELARDAATRGLRVNPRQKKSKVEQSDTILPPKTSKKILAAIEEQNQEEEANIDLTGAKEDLESECEEVEVDEEGFLKLLECNEAEEAALAAFLPGGNNDHAQSTNNDVSVVNMSAMGEEKSIFDNSMFGDSNSGSLLGAAGSIFASSAASKTVFGSVEPLEFGSSSSSSNQAANAVAAGAAANDATSVGPPSRNLGDIILQAMAKKQEEQKQEETKSQMSEKGKQCYTAIGKWLKNYKMGKLPNAFTCIPTLVNWEEAICLTEPLDWSPNACREATKIFASNLNVRMAQRFLNLVLLPAIRQNMEKHKKLNYHYYEALKKAMFKPAAFMKGILLPLAGDGSTLREAHIVSSILQKISIPVLHASATLIKLCELQPWYGTTSIFMAALINKKYSLPYSVIGRLVEHFAGFTEDERCMPLVWHRCFMLFIQRYKHEFSEVQRKQLLKLIDAQWHDGIGPECKRELKSVVAAPKGGAMELD